MIIIGGKNLKPPFFAHEESQSSEVSMFVVTDVLINFNLLGYFSKVRWVLDG
jgi:hypothetical protein